MKAVRHEIVSERADETDEMILVNVECPECKGRNGVVCKEEGYRRWLDGDLIQRALPEVPKELREVLMTGICPSCWEKLWSE